MNSKSFCRPRRRRPPIEARAPAVSQMAAVLLGLGALAAAGVAMAGDAPAWMHAQVNAPLPAHDEKTAAVMLYSDTVLTVQSNGKMRRQLREVYRILRPEGQARAVVRITFDDQSRIRYLHAWCIPTEGKDYEVKERDSTETSVQGVPYAEFVTDLHVKLLQIPAATPGSVVGFEVEQDVRPYDLAHEWDFQDTVPVREAHYTLQLPPGWSYKATWVNHADESADTTIPNQWRWVVNDLKAIRIEPNMPSLRGLRGKLAISLAAPDSKLQGFQSWQDVGTWYLGLAAGRRDASPEIKQKVAELTADAPSTLGKMRAIAEFVQNDIRYVAIELGIGGFQPHPAADIFLHRYGDCKDKVTLFSSMLEQIGIDSYYVIINTERGAVNGSTLPNLGFNHVIAAIRLPDGVDDATLAAVLPDPKLGRILIFDPTDYLMPFGAIPGQLQASFGLLVTPDSSRLIEMPQLAPESNGLQRTGQFTLDDDGSLHGDVHELRIGDLASTQRYALRATKQDSDRAKPLEALLNDSISIFQIEKATISNLHATYKPLEWNYTLFAQSYAKFSGDLLILRPRVLGTNSRNFLETKEPRENSIELDGPEIDTDVFEITLPAGYAVEQLPIPTEKDYSFASYHSETKLVGHTLRYSRTFEVKELDVPVAQAEDLKALYRAVYNDERNSAVLERTGR
jgi:hypothetical protein